ncbi:hypothetical protein TNCV_1833051 [Trichonephila clavipes]|nr:hypothetical protein TNCV_1833051 [Trichonephila clavipes]
MNLICSLPCPPMSLQDMTPTRETNPVEARRVGSCLNSKSRAIVGKAGHQFLFFPSVGVWGKFNFYICHHSDHFFPLQRNKRVKRHRIRPMKAQGRRHIYQIFYISKHSRINCEQPILQSS